MLHIGFELIRAKLSPVGERASTYRKLADDGAGSASLLHIGLQRFAQKRGGHRLKTKPIDVSLFVL
jgi:hypothetical protein